jgi:hypothetical protein
MAHKTGSQPNSDPAKPKNNEATLELDKLASFLFDQYMKSKRKEYN